MPVRGVKISLSVGHLLSSYEVILGSRARIWDYSSFPSSSPCFDPFCSQATLLFPTRQSKHLWINWAWCMDRFYLHRAGLVPKCSFPVSLIPMSREQSYLASGMLFKVASLFLVLFNIRGVGFQLPWLPELLLTFMNRAFIQSYPSGLRLLCTVCSHGTTGNMRSGFIFFPVPALFFLSPVFWFLSLFSSL